MDSTISFSYEDVVEEEGRKSKKTKVSSFTVTKIFEKAVVLTRNLNKGWTCA